MAFVIQGSFLKNGDQAEALELGIDEGKNSLIYVLKIYKYKSSLHKLIRKLHIFLLIKTLVKN